MLVAGAAFLALFLYAAADLPAFGHYRGPYGLVINHVAGTERQVTNAVAALVFDFRGYDTLGEELILFISVVGVTTLLRAQRDETEEPVGGAELEQPPRPSEALRRAGVIGVAATLLIGVYLVAHGAITPGGGFQGGAAMASGLVLLYFATDYGVFNPFGREAIFDPVEAVGAGGYAVIGIAALLSGLPFLTNLFGPGTTGTLVSAGSIPFLNWASALEVTAANLVLFSEFLHEYIASGE